MSAQGNPEEICKEIAGELREMATWLSSGQLSPERFRQAVLALEAAKVARFGFTLRGVSSPEGRTQFELQFADSGERCATMEFDPATGEITTQHLCGE